MQEQLRDRLGESLWRLVIAVGTPLVRADEITVVPANGMPRTYRLWFEGGRTLKGRCFRTSVLAEVAWRIHKTAAAPFLARVVSHDAEAMLEEWVEGEILVEGHVGHRCVRDAGRMLGTLHCCPPPATDDIAFRPLDARGWVRKTEANLRTLRDCGVVSPECADRLQRLAMSHLPARATLGVVHRDLCPENLIRDAQHRLVSVDNGSLTIGTIEEDLCRVWYRWPMTADERAAFIDGYQEYRDAEGLSQPPVFWVVVVIVNSARARLGLTATAAAAALQRLDQFLSETQADRWASGPGGASA
jgi:aminoglycoside phosphotransferase (APT) family kinase protein